MMRVASILFFTILILISAQDEPYFHSISVYVNGNPLILNFTEDEDYRTIATAFASENRLADLAGRCRQVEPSESNEWPECIVDSMVDDMRKAVTYDVATSAAHGQRSFETKKDREVSLIIVDDFLSQPDAMRLFGLSCQFAYKGNHPGQRTASFANLKAFRPIRRAVEELVGEKLPYWFASFQRSYSNDTDNGVVWSASIFELHVTFGLSFTTRCLFHLLLFVLFVFLYVLCVQHRDSGAYKYSAILYLTPGSPPQLGTSTWKHQATGLYGDPTTSDLARNNKTADALLRILEDDPNQEQYDEIDRIGNRFNRLLVRLFGLLLFCFSPHLRC
jgi:hypothetical protein